MKTKQYLLLALILGLIPIAAMAEGIGQFRFILPVSSGGTASTLGETNVSASINETIVVPPITQAVSLTVSGAFEETLDEDPKSTAYSLHYIFPFGLGVGYTSQVIQYKVGLATSRPTTVSGSISGIPTSYTLDSGYVSAVETIKLDLGYLDLLYVYRFLDNFSVTAGAGVPIIKAQADISVSSGTGSTQSKVLDGLIQGALESSDAENTSAYSLFLMFGYEIKNFEIVASYRKTTLAADYKLNSFMSDFLNKDTIKWNLDITEILVGLGYRF
jgi:opacity protein-like surface antigen